MSRRHYETRSYVHANPRTLSKRLGDTVQRTRGILHDIESDIIFSESEIKVSWMVGNYALELHRGNLVVIPTRLGWELLAELMFWACVTRQSRLLDAGVQCLQSKIEQSLPSSSVLMALLNLPTDKPTIHQALVEDFLLNNGLKTKEWSTPLKMCQSRNDAVEDDGDEGNEWDVEDYGDEEDDGDEGPEEDEDNKGDVRKDVRDAREDISDAGHDAQDSAGQDNAKTVDHSVGRGVEHGAGHKSEGQSEHGFAQDALDATDSSNEDNVEDHHGDTDSDYSPSSCSASDEDIEITEEDDVGIRRIRTRQRLLCLKQYCGKRLDYTSQGRTSKPSNDVDEDDDEKSLDGIDEEEGNEETLKMGEPHDQDVVMEDLENDTPHAVMGDATGQHNGDTDYVTLCHDNLRYFLNRTNSNETKVRERLGKERASTERAYDSLQQKDSEDEEVLQEDFDRLFHLIFRYAPG